MILTGLVVTAAFLPAYSIFTSGVYMATISNPAFPQEKPHLATSAGAD
jgi:hypothetical protein